MDTSSKPDDLEQRVASSLLDVLIRAGLPISEKQRAFFLDK